MHANPLLLRVALVMKVMNAFANQFVSPVNSGILNDVFEVFRYF